MYCTTDPKQIEAEVATARRVIAKYERPDLPSGFTLASPESNSVGIVRMSQGQIDALAAAHATVHAYADLLDENDKVAEYRSLS
jgi:hypothetical protein